MASDRVEAIDAYQRHIKNLGYSSGEATLLIIGFDAGWREARNGE